jgi:flagellar basal-body rod protein FlgB
MDLPQIPLLAMLKERMSWLDARQNILSQNVANVDTPGYAARDLKQVDFEQTLREVTRSNQFAGTLMTDNPRHIAITQQNGGFDDVNSPDVETNPSGNSVSLEQEMIKVSDTQAQYQAAADLYAKVVTMMKTAIGHGGS